ncbi:class II aldolase/adducin family protein [Roseomonas elaeocarpi]|uniref:Class II aldolase/adducin family protein n=1 Tax=Roseomonas elaeocarpi TaxID=907779 RepID=A0ABV6JPK7_9PROT
MTEHDADEARIADLVTASHILAHEGILDSFGHVSTRSTADPERFFIPRAMPPALVARGDVVEVGLDGRAVELDAPRLNGERFIHAEIYRARPEVQSVIHTHDLAVIPFTLSRTPLRPVVVQAGFLPPETPVFEIRDVCGHLPLRGMLVTNPTLGKALAGRLSCHPVVLMRGHGNTVVGASVREATVRTIYTHINARAQAAAMQMGSGEVIALDEAELAFNAQENFDAGRPWENYRVRMLRARAREG